MLHVDFDVTLVSIVYTQHLHWESVSSNVAIHILDRVVYLCGSVRYCAMTNKIVEDRHQARAVKTRNLSSTVCFCHASFQQSQVENLRFVGGPSWAPWWNRMRLEAFYSKYRLDVGL